MEVYATLGHVYTVICALAKNIHLDLACGARVYYEQADRYGKRGGRLAKNVGGYAHVDACRSECSSQCEDVH